MFGKRNSDSTGDTSRNIELINQVLKKPSFEALTEDSKPSTFGFVSSNEGSQSAGQEFVDTEQAYNTLSTTTSDDKVINKPKQVNVLFTRFVSEEFLKSKKHILIKRNRALLALSINLLCCTIGIFMSSPITSHLLIRDFKEKNHFFFASIVSLSTIFIGLVGVMKVNFTLISTYFVLALLTSSIATVYSVFFLLKRGGVYAYVMVLILIHLIHLAIGAYSFSFLKQHFYLSKRLKKKRLTK